MDQPEKRRDRLGVLLSQEGLDTLIISNPVNVTYLTGFTGDSSVLILARQPPRHQCQAWLVSDRRYTQQIEEECPGLKAHIRPPTTKLLAAVGEVLKKQGGRDVGFESGALTVAEYEELGQQVPDVNWKGGSDRVEQLRQVKDESEIALIRRAIDIAERAFSAFSAMLRMEDREKDLCDAMEAYIRHAGGECSSFPPIVAVGERAALPHAPPTDRQVGSGELLLVDWGASGRGYKSDLTRVLGRHTTGSSFPDKLREVHGVVAEAQKQAIAAIRPGVQAQEIDAVARGVIAEAGYGDYFGHGLGHGIGLEIHEGPSIRPNSSTVLEKGMVFTVEPGIYLPDWGGVRIEDDVLVTEDGHEVLTSPPRELDALRVLK